MSCYIQLKITHFDVYHKGLKYRKMESLKYHHLCSDHEELDAIFKRYIDALKAGTLTPEQLSDLKDWCVLGFKIKDEIATEHHLKNYKFRDRLEGIFRTKLHREVVPFKKKINDLVKEIWE